MSDFGPLVGWGVVVAASVVAGSVAAAALRLPPRGAALVSSFAGGVLLAAVAFELVPDADERTGLWMTAVGLLRRLQRSSRTTCRHRASTISLPASRRDLVDLLLTMFTIGQRRSVKSDPDLTQKSSPLE